MKLSDFKGRTARKNAVILGVFFNSANNKKLAEKFSFNFPLICNTDRRSRVIVVLVPLRALVLALAVVAGVAPAYAATVTVSTTGDVVNGTVTSPAALKASPGPDGISLREAMLATNKTVGPHTITFGGALAGRTIVVTSPLPPMRRDRVQVLGLVDADGRPTVTIDAAAVAGCCSLATFLVQASHVTLRSLRIVRVSDRSFGVMIRSGAISTPVLTGPRVVNNVRIEDSVFDNTGAGGSPYAVSVGTDCCAGVTNTTIANVLIAGNVFKRFAGDGDSVHVQAAGIGNVILDLVVADNAFSDGTFPVELVPLGPDTRISRTRILRNRFVRNHQAISIGAIHRAGDPTLTGTLIDNTVIEGNVFDRGSNPSISVNGGHGDTTANVISGVRIASNVVANGSPYGGILICGGSTGASGNLVRGVRIVNTTVTRNGAMLDVLQDCDPSAGGNTAEPIDIRSSIFWGTGGFGGVTPDQVRFSIVHGGGFAGVNGNLDADPRFANPDTGNFRLKAVSPAIDAGTSAGAPVTDVSCRPRVDDATTPNTGGGPRPFYDIGAYEFGSAATPCAPLWLLGVVKQGGGSGRVTGAGITCGADCGDIYPDGAKVTLTPVVAAGSVFAGWGAPCSGTGTCTVTVRRHRSIVATFTRAP